MNFNIHPRYEVLQRVLSPNVEGYDVEVKKVFGNGIIHCIFDSRDDKRGVKRLRRSMSYFYEDEEIQTAYRKTLDNLAIGEICLARIKKSDEVIKAKKLTGALTFQHHRVRVTSVTVVERDEVTESEKDPNVKVTVKVKDAWVKANFIDEFRDAATVNIQQVYHINPQFLVDPAYMIRCQLADVGDLEGTAIVEKVLTDRPPPESLRVMLIAQRSEFKKGKGDDKKLPAVAIRKAMGSSMFDMKEYVMRNMDVVGPLSLLMANEECICRIGDTDNAGHIWVCPIFHLEWAIALVDRLSRKMYALPEIQLLSGMHLCSECVKRDENVEGPAGLYLAVRDPAVNHPGVESVQFNRAKILLVDHETATVIVRHIDTGEKVIYAPEDLYHISEYNRTLSLIPPLAIQVRLQYVDSLSKEGVWYLMDTVRKKNVIVKMARDQTRNFDGVRDVKILINPDTPEEENLSSHLISKVKLAVPCKPKPKV